MRIDLRCCGGATASFDDPPRSYAEPGGKAVGPRGRLFRVELLADDWLDRHALCKPTQPSPRPEGADHAE